MNEFYLVALLLVGVIVVNVVKQLCTTDTRSFFINCDGLGPIVYASVPQFSVGTRIFHVTDHCAVDVYRWAKAVVC